MTTFHLLTALASTVAVLGAAQPLEAAKPPGRQGGSPVSRLAESNRLATQQPTRQGFVQAVQIYPFADGALYQVHTAPGRVTDVMLEAGETLVAVASGDTARWVIGDTSSGAGPQRRTHILVKPFSSGLSTNLVITTDRRTYYLALNSNARTAMAALSWTYPQDALIALRQSQGWSANSSPVTADVAVDRLQFGYVISGDKPAWRPIRAFDDGRQTFIEFPASLGVGEAPPLFLVGTKGEAQLVNYRLRGRYYVVDRLFDTAELRLGTKRQEVVRIRRGNGRGRRPS